MWKIQRPARARGALWVYKALVRRTDVVDGHDGGSEKLDEAGSLMIQIRVSATAH